MNGPRAFFYYEILDFFIYDAIIMDYYSLSMWKHDRNKVKVNGTGCSKVINKEK